MNDKGTSTKYPLTSRNGATYRSPIARSPKPNTIEAIPPRNSQRLRFERVPSFWVMNSLGSREKHGKSRRSAGNLSRGNSWCDAETTRIAGPAAPNGGGCEFTQRNAYVAPFLLFGAVAKGILQAVGGSLSESGAAHRMVSASFKRPRR